MGLSNDLISQFVKATTNTKKVKTESVVYGTAKQHGDLMYVMLDGSDQLTPVSTTVAVKDGERVTIRIKDHSAVVTGNLSYPAAKNETVEALGKKVSYFDEISAYKVTTDELDAVLATIDNLLATTAKIENMEVVTAQIETLQAKFAELDKVTAEDAEILNAEIENLEATIGNFKDLSAEDFEAITADIGSLKSYVGNFTYLHADVLTAMKGEITELDTKKLSAESADIKYVNIDFANIDEAWFKKFYAESGLIRDVYADDATITGYLVGVTIKGDLIEANTLKADKLVVLGEDGIYYKLNFEAGTFKDGEAVPTDSLHGSIITAKSVTAEKVSVSDLVAFDATIAGFNITRDEDDGLGKIYSGVKESVNNTTRGIYLDNQGQVAFGDSSNYLKYFKDTDGNWKLAIAANAIVMSASGTSVDEAISNVRGELDNLQIGARNLIRNSKTLIFEDYEFVENADAVVLGIAELGVMSIGDESEEQTGTEGSTVIDLNITPIVTGEYMPQGFVDGMILHDRHLIAMENAIIKALGRTSTSPDVSGVAAARITTITLLADSWTGSGTIYSQAVAVNGVTAYSKIDLLPSPEQLNELLLAEISLTAANSNGSITVFALGDVPMNNITMQAMITEVIMSEVSV